MAKVKWGPGNPLWEWQHRKANKSQTVHKSTVRHMAKTRRTRRYSRRLRRAFRRVKDKRIPLIPTLAGVAPTLRAFEHFNSPDAIMQNPVGFVKQIVYENTGYDATTGQMNFGVLTQNAMLWGGALVAHKALNYIGVNRAIGKVPFVGKHISL